jgi:M6 family metalloprotease-like protein
MMKNKNKLYVILKIIILLLFITSCTYNTFNSSKADSKPTLFKTNDTLQNKGKHVTSKGELRTLIINVIFKDDTTNESEGWKISKTELPTWSKTLLNKTTELNFSHQNLTQYFFEMSNGNFMFYGDVYPKVIVPQYGQSHYKSIGEVNTEILTKLDAEIDFSKYDNWSKGKDGKYINTPDGKVDMIFILYRNFENKLFFNKGWTGIAHLYLSEDIETDDGVKISTGRLDKGSGIQSRGGYNGYDYTKYVLAHEFGHFLFGAFHIENTTNLALMTGGPVWNASRGMHSWERYKLGWMNYKDIPLNTNSDIELDDYITTGEAARLKITENEWYVLENHQQLSNNDWAKSKGVYIYHVENAKGYYPKISVKCADGNWNFEINEKDEKLIKTIPNRFGKTELSFGRKFKKKSYAAYQQIYGDNSAWGDELDAFNIDYNNLISPSSNPPSNNKAGIDFAIKIKEEKGNKIVLDIFFKDIYVNTPPSKPQLIEIVKDSTGSLNMSWLKNEEPDLVGYNLYFATDPGSVRSIYFPFNVRSTRLNELIQINNKNIVWLTAVDKDNKESIQSDYFEIIFDSDQNSWRWIRKEKL